MLIQLLPLVAAGIAAFVTIAGWLMSYRFGVRKDIISGQRERDRELIEELMRTYPLDDFSRMIERGDVEAIREFTVKWSRIEAEFLHPRLAKEFSTVMWALDAMLLANALQDPGAKVRRILGINFVFSNALPKGETAQRIKVYRRNARIAAKRRYTAIGGYARLIRIGRRLT